MVKESRARRLYHPAASTAARTTLQFGATHSSLEAVLMRHAADRPVP
jgi:hypothetical protein